jgi:oligopeptidase B
MSDRRHIGMLVRAQGLVGAAVCAFGVACSELPVSPGRDPGDAWFDRTLAPPIAERRPHERRRHGRTFVDEYHWMRDRSDPAVIQYLRAENEYALAAMAPTEPLRAVLYEEMAERLSVVDRSVPERDGDYLYYTRTEPGKQYPYRCRKKVRPDAAEEIILDENELSEGHDYFRIGDFEVSPDQRLAAYSVDIDGSERYSVFVVDLTTGRLLEDRIRDTYDALEWGNDSRTLYYSTLDATLRPYRLHRHRLGEEQAADELLYQEGDGAFYLSFHKTSSRRYLILQLESTIASEQHLLDADDPAGQLRVIEPRRAGTVYSAGHWKDRLYIRTNDGGGDFRLVEAPISDPSRSNWKGAIAPAAGVVLEDFQLFAEHLVAVERRGGIRGLRIFDLLTFEGRGIDFAEPIHTVRLSENPRFDSRTLRFAYESLVDPESIYEYEMDSGEQRLLRRREIGGGFDRTSYTSERTSAETSDGTKVPILLVYKKGIRRDGSNPLLLYAYGSGNLMVEPGFSTSRLSLLDRGVIYAIAQIRGGGELGWAWSEQGRLLAKMNSFTDLIDCAEHLIASGYTSSDRLAIQGGSAGGLLVGAVVTLRPDLFRAVVAEVPFVDVINTQEDATIPLVVTGWEEWGDPRRRDHFEYMLAYSPYDNVAARDYPHMMITGGLNDPRVPFWEPAKWTARLRAAKTSGHLLVLRTNMGAGHGGASGRYDALEERAFEYAFILKSLGVEE